MNYTYSLIYNSTSILRNDGAVIPADPGNTDYKAYLAWVAAGNTPTPSTAPANPPVIVQMWQAKAILQSTPFTPTQAETAYQTIVAGTTNLLAATNALVAAQNNPTLTTFWNDSATIASNDTTLNSLATMLGITSTQVNALFAQAAALTL